MFHIDDYDREHHGVVVGADLKNEGRRSPVLNFLSEGDARLFCNYLNRFSWSRTVETQLILCAQHYQEYRGMLVTDFDFRISGNELRMMKLKRRSPKELIKEGLL